MADDKPSLTKPTTLETFFKSRTDLRIAVEAISFLQSELDTLGEQIAKEATRTAKQEKRTTILQRDIKEALTTLLGQTSLEGIFKRLETLSAKDTAQLSQQIEIWLKEH